MSGVPPHHPQHGRQAPAANTAWNHLQVRQFVYLYLWLQKTIEKQSYSSDRKKSTSQ